MARCSDGCRGGSPSPSNPPDVAAGRFAAAFGTKWLLRGITSNERYVVREEKDRLVAKQPSLGRAEATCAALILSGKTPHGGDWLKTNAGRFFEEQSRHIHIGLQYLPAVARRLHHCRDTGESEPFDFLTWFEYSPSDEPGFNRLLAELRASVEWKYVDREIDIRLVHEPA